MGKNKFSIASRIYEDDFKTVVFIVLNQETGEFTEHVFKKNKESSDEDVSFDNEEEPCKYEMEIRADTADNIRDEIIRLGYKHPCSDVQYVWNKAIIEAANCCNGYEQEEED